MFANHLSGTAKLFQAANAELTGSAVCQVMYAHTIARRDMFDLGTNFVDATGDFVAERDRQTVNPGDTGTIMRVRMTDPGSRNANQNVGGTNLGDWNIDVLQP